MHLVTDRDAGDPVGAEVLARLGTALPDASMTVTHVARGDTLEAGAWVARLAGGQGAAGSLVAHDVASAPGQPDPWPAGSVEQLCMGRTVVGALVVGANRGWTWSYVVADLQGIVLAGRPDRRRHRPTAAPGDRAGARIPPPSARRHRGGPPLRRPAPAGAGLARSARETHADPRIGLGGPASRSLTPSRRRRRAPIARRASCAAPPPAPRRRSCRPPGRRAGARAAGCSARRSAPRSQTRRRCRA